MADRPSIVVELTNSLCSTCLRKVEAKVIFQEGRVYLVKHCPEHKQQKVLISTDVEYYQFSRRALKPAAHSGMPRWQDRLFIRLAGAANDATDYFQIPTGRVVEVGTQVTI